MADRVEGQGPRFTAPAVKFDDDTRAELAGSLRFDVGDEAASDPIAAAQRIVRDAAGVRESIDRGPQQSNRAQRLRDVIDAARELEDALARLDQLSVLELQDSGDWVDIDADGGAVVNNALNELIKDAESVRAGVIEESRVYRPKESARDDAIRFLVEIFRKSARRPQDEDYEGHMVDFVQCALAAGGLPCPESHEETLRLIRRSGHRVKDR